MIITQSASNNRNYLELYDKVFCNRAGAECDSDSCHNCTIFNSPEANTFGREVEDQERLDFTHGGKSYIIEAAGYSNETSRFSLWDVTQPEATRLIFDKCYNINKQDENSIRRDLEIAGYGDLYDVIDDISC